MAVISFKCPNCDGELIFDPETQKYKCEYCGSKFTQAELDALQPAESEETDAGAADGSDEAEQETTEQQSPDTKKKEGALRCAPDGSVPSYPAQKPARLHRPPAGWSRCPAPPEESDSPGQAGRMPAPAPRLWAGP